MFICIFPGTRAVTDVRGGQAAQAAAAAAPGGRRGRAWCGRHRVDHSCLRARLAGRAGEGPSSRQRGSPEPRAEREAFPNAVPRA